MFEDAYKLLSLSLSKKSHKTTLSFKSLQPQEKLFILALPHL